MGDRGIPASSRLLTIVMVFVVASSYSSSISSHDRPSTRMTMRTMDGSDNQGFPRLPIFQSVAVEHEHENDWEREPLGALEHTRTLNEGGDFGEAKAIL